MRVLFATLPEPARLHNLVPTAWALRAAGHEVQIASRPDFTETVTRTGVVAVAVGETGTGFADAPAVDDLIEFAALWRPDLVVWDEGALAGPVAARVAGVPSVRMLTGSDESVVAEAEFAERVDLARVNLVPDKELVHGDITLDPTPQSLRLPVGGDHRPIRFVPYAGPSVVPTWLRRAPRRPRVLVVGNGRVPVDAVFEAVAGLDVEVVSAVGVDGLAFGATVPDNVRLVESVAWNAVLLTCSAVVHGGDASVALSALAYGLPQLVVDRNGLTRRIADAGAGAAVEPHEVRPELVHRVATGTEFGANARAFASEIAAAPSPVDLVSELVEAATLR